MSTRRAAAAAVVVTLLTPPAFAAAQRSWTAFDAPYEEAADTGRAPTFAFMTDTVSRISGLHPLRRVVLPDGHRELRIWTGFGIVIPHRLLRIVESPDTVRGELVEWWTLPPDPASDSVYAEFFERMEAAAGRYGCNEEGGPDPSWDDPGPHTYSLTDWVTACKIDRGEAGPSWAVLLAELDRLGTFTLPDPATFEPPGDVVVDGVSVQVELLEGDRYRSYTYGNPHVRPWPEAEAADSLLKLVQGLERGR